MAKKNEEYLIPKDRVEQYLGDVNIDTPRMRRLAKKVRKSRDYGDLMDLKDMQKISINPEININKEDFHTLDNAFSEYSKSDEFGHKEFELRSKAQSENNKFKKALEGAVNNRALDSHIVNELLFQMDYGERPSDAMSRVVAPSYFSNQDKINLNRNKLEIKDFLSQYAKENASFSGAHNALSDFQSGKTFKNSNNTEEQEKYMQLYADNLEKDVNDTVDYFNALYNTKRARRGVRRIDKYAQKIIESNPEEHNYENMHPMRVGSITVQNDSADIGVNKGGRIVIGSRGSERYPRKGTLAHEIAHNREPFNYRNYKKKGQREDSPSYNNDYSVLREKHKRWLKPEVPWKVYEDDQVRYNHDIEISEAFSDLAGLRQDLYDAGIADGTKRRYRNKDIKAMRESSEFDSRYLDYHSNNNMVRKALNRIWANGGDMSDDENVESDPIDGGVLEAAVVTQDDDFNKFLATLPANQRETPEDKYYTYKMWKIAGRPKDFNQAVDMGLYHWNDSDRSYHGNSVIYDEESDVYHFLKPKDHSTVQYELDWYNKGVTTDDNGNQYELAGDSKAEWEDFRRNYYLDSSGDDYAYRRKPTLGVSEQSRNSIMAALENGVKAALQNKISSINQSLQESKVNKFDSGGPTEPLYYDNTPIEPAVVKAFNSGEEYNRYYGEQFGKKVAKGTNDIAQSLFEGLKYTPLIGDVLDAENAVIDAYNGNYRGAATLAGLAILPNIIEKPIKAVSKPLKRFLTHGIDSDSFKISMRNWKGSPMPSMAVNDVDLPMFDYGDMTFIGSSDLLDNSIIFKGDGMTPTISTVGGDYVDDVQEVIRRMKAQQNNDDFNIGEIISKEEASTLPISGKGLEQYFEAKYQDFIPWDQFKHLVTHGDLDPKLLKFIEELKIPHTNVSDKDYIETIKKIAAEEGLLFKRGGKLNTFSEGGDKNNVEAEIWKRKYKDLPEGFKQAVVKLVEDLNYNSEDVEQLFDSGALRAALDAKYIHAESGRVRNNDSPTSEASSSLEDRMNSSIYNPSKRVLPNMKYAIPYIEDLEVIIPGVGRTTTNALDSLAKYAYEAQIPLEEALGLGAQETAFGATPLGNYKNVPKNATEEERKEILEYNRALGNSSYFRNYGSIPAENIVRDFRYNIVEDPISRDTPPLLHAFNYWKDGNYNRGDKNHTSDVIEKGRAVMNTKPVQEWIENSEFAQKVINLFK